MRARGIGLTCGVLALLGLATSASEEYVEAMRSLGTVAQGLGPAIDDQDHEAMNALVLRTRLAVDVVQQFWRDSGVEETDVALETVRATSKAISEISVAVHLMNISPNPVAVEGAQIALKDLRAACATCHAAHRDEQPDGSYLIK